MNVVQGARWWTLRFLVLSCRLLSRNPQLAWRALPGSVSEGRVSLARVPLRADPLPPPPAPPPGRCSAAAQVLPDRIIFPRSSITVQGRSLPAPSPPYHHHRRWPVGPPGSRASRKSRACTGSPTTRVSLTTRGNRQRCCLPPLSTAFGTPNISPFSRLLNSRPACTPVNASLHPHGTPTHDSGPPRIAPPQCRRGSFSSPSPCRFIQHFRKRASCFPRLPRPSAPKPGCPSESESRAGKSRARAVAAGESGAKGCKTLAPTEGSACPNREMAGSRPHPHASRSPGLLRSHSCLISALKTPGRPGLSKVSPPAEATRRSSSADQRPRLCGADDEIVKVPAHLESTRLFDPADLQRLEAGRPD